MSNANYIVKPFYFVNNGKTNILFVNNNVFSIDNSHVLNWIKSLVPHSNILREDIVHYASISELNQEEFIEYLTNTLNILHPIKQATIVPITFICEIDYIRSIFKQLHWHRPAIYLDKLPTHYPPNDEGICISLFPKTNAQQANQYLSTFKYSTVVTSFFDTIYIDGLWIPKLHTPCHACHNDAYYAISNHSSSKNLVSLWDIYKILSTDFKENLINFTLDDICFIAKYLRKYINIVSGIPSDDKLFDPIAATAININSLEIQQTRIPISLNCDCFNHIGTSGENND